MEHLEHPFHYLELKKCKKDIKIHVKTHIYAHIRVRVYRVFHLTKMRRKRWIRNET